MSLPPTDQNLAHHMRRAHLQAMLWKAADQLGPPDISITDYEWEIKDGIPNPTLDGGPPGPKELIDVISCRCKAEGKVCKGNCSCNRESLSCTTYCYCSAQVSVCNNPFTRHEDEDDDGDESEDDEFN